MTGTRVYVVPLEIAFEGAVLPDGSVMTIELAERRQAFGVVYDDGVEVSILSMHDDKTDAIYRCESLARTLRGPEESEEQKPN